MAYQSFEDQKGDSDSFAKLAKIGLPKDLTGKSLLDIGCNEGFFCREAVNRRAKHVVGIDTNPEIIKAAELRSPTVKFYNCSWWGMPTGKYDYILFLSAIHYEREQKKLLDYLSNFLTPTGTLILECGVLEEYTSKQTHLLDRHDGLFVYPSWRTLLEDQLSSYAVRDMGRSVQQAGDPMPRFVFHCRRKKPTVIIIVGQPGAGKTGLAREFAAKNIPTISLDAHYTMLASRDNKAPFSKSWQYFNSVFRHTGIDDVLRKVVADGKEAMINDLIIPLINPGEGLTIVEGFQFSVGRFLEDFKTRLETRGFVVQILNSSF
jgi:SAM-dependent methyltransferase